MNRHSFNQKTHASQVEERRAASAAQVPSSSPALRVLLVEDSRIISDLIQESLARIDGLELVGIAETEGEALRLLTAEPSDVLILDIQLKQGNGINLLRTLATSAQQLNTLKVVLSNHVSSTYRRICEQYGVQFFFDKSTEFPKLHLLLTQLSGRSPSIPDDGSSDWAARYSR